MKNLASLWPLMFAALLSAQQLQAQEAPSFLLGSAMPAEQAHRTIVITADTKWANVVRNESIRFVVNGTSFGWRFDGPGGRPVDLQNIAPPGLLAHPVLVYITMPGELTRSPL